MNVCVTGGGGFVGRFVVAELLQHGHHVRVAEIGPGAREGAEWVQADLRRLEELEAAFAGMDGVCHLAAVPTRRPPEEWSLLMETNVMGTYNVLEAARRCGVGVVASASSICAYGWPPLHEGSIAWSYLPVDEEHPVFPEDPYDMSKLIGEIIGRSYAARFGMRVICLRLANVLDAEGPEGTRALATPITWCKVDVRDVAQAFRRSLESEVAFGIYNVSSARRYAEDGSPATPEATLHEVLAHRVPAISDPGFLGGGPSFSSAKARRELGYEPRY